MSSNKVLITGSGKCGTTFFIDLLTELGLDTGYTPGDIRAGEWDVMFPNAQAESQPYIIKSPFFCTEGRIAEMIERWDWNVERVYVLLRDYNFVANNMWKRYRDKHGWPEITDQEYKRKDEKWLHYKNKAARFVGYMMFQLVSLDIPYTILMFPRIIEDPEYLWSNCELLQSLDYETFKLGFDKVADLDRVHWGRRDHEIR